MNLCKFTRYPLNDEILIKQEYVIYISETKNKHGTLHLVNGETITVNCTMDQAYATLWTVDNVGFLEQLKSTLDDLEQGFIGVDEAIKAVVEAMQ